MSAEIEWRFVRSAGPIGRAISWFGADHYSHVDVVDSAGWLWGSHSDAIRVTGYDRPFPAGFQKRPPFYERWLEVTGFRLKVSPIQYQRFWDFIGKQLATPYDTRGLISTFLLGRNWRDPSAWFCSEVQAAACEYAMIIPHVWKQVNAIDPGDFALMLNVRGAPDYELPCV